MAAPHNQSLYFRHCLPLYDIVFTTKSYNCGPTELPALGARRVSFVDKAYDRHLHRPIVPAPDQASAFGADIGFIGSYEDVRGRKLLALAGAGFSVRVWGNGWERMNDSHPRLRLERRPLFNEDYVKAICATRINLCFLRK